MKRGIAAVVLGLCTLAGGCETPWQSNEQKIDTKYQSGSGGNTTNPQGTHPGGANPNGVIPAGGTMQPQGQGVPQSMIPSVQPPGTPTSYFSPRSKPATGNSACST